MKNEKMTIGTVNPAPRVLLMGCACVVTSMLTLEQLRKYCVYLPEELELKNRRGEVIYAIRLDDEAPGCITDEDTVYSGTTTEDGRATVTVLIDPECRDKKEAVRQNLSAALKRLNTLERRLTAKLPGLVEAERKAWEPAGNLS